jgi:subtilisin family serine protease
LPSLIAPSESAGAPAVAVPGREVSSEAHSQSAPSDRVSVLVYLEPGADRGPLRQFARREGGRVAYEYRILPDLVNLRELPESALDRLSRVAGVVRVERDPEVKLHLTQSTPLIRALQSQIIAAGSSASGSGVRVCTVDTGVRADHIMYNGRIDLAASYDFVHDDPDPDDEHGHGSHVMGIAIGGTDVITDVGCGWEPLQGVAPSATGIAEKVIDASGTGSGSNIIAAIQRCADPNLPGGPADVINLSIGGGSFKGTCDSDALASAANAAVDAGVVVVASSGNDGSTNALASPACGSKVIAVGATYDTDYPSCDIDQGSFLYCLAGNVFVCTKFCEDDFPTTDQIACFSNQSSNLDVVAPGCVTWSAEPSADNTITTLCGTSMAAPHVSGLAALLLDENPTLTPAQVRQAIRDGAIDKGLAGFDKIYGYGRVDALNSLALASSPGCSTNGDCNDGNLCTTDACSGSVCSHTPTSCDDGNLCTVDICDPVSGCVHQAVNCDDANTCTSDSCSAATGCVHTPICGTCAASGESCTSNADCCSSKCRGRSSNKRCR